MVMLQVYHGLRSFSNFLRYLKLAEVGNKKRRPQRMDDVGVQWGPSGSNREPAVYETAALTT